MTLAALIDEQHLLTVLKGGALVHCNDRLEAGLNRGWPVLSGRWLRSAVNRLRSNRLRSAVNRLRSNRLRSAVNRLRFAVNR